MSVIESAFPSGLLQVAFNALLWCLALFPAVLISVPCWTISRILTWLRFGHRRTKLVGQEVLHMCDDKNSKGIMTLYCALSGPLSKDQLEENTRRFQRAVNEHPELSWTSYPVEIHGYYYWKKQEDFDLKKHCHLLDGVDPNKTYSRSEIHRIYSDQVHNAPFPERRPQWDLYYVPKFVFDEEVEQPGADKKSFCILRAHHSVGDGISWYKTLKKYMFEETYEYAPVPPVAKMSWWFTAILNAAAIVNIPSVFCLAMLRRLRNSSRLPSLSGQKIICTASLDIDTIRFIKSQADCGFSDVVLSSIGSTLQKYFSRQKFCPKVIRTGLPIAFPSDDDEIISHNYTGVTLTFSGKDLGPMERLKDTTRILNGLKRSLEPLSVYWSLRLMGLIPFPLCQTMARYVDHFAFISYVPGRGPRMSNNGVRLEHSYFTSINRDKTGITVTANTYVQDLNVCFLVDSALVSGQKEVQDMADDVINNLIHLSNIVGRKDVKTNLNISHDFHSAESKLGA